MENFDTIRLKAATKKRLDDEQDFLRRKDGKKPPVYSVVAAVLHVRDEEFYNSEYVRGTRKEGSGRLARARTFPGKRAGFRSCILPTVVIFKRAARESCELAGGSDQ